MRKNTCKHFRGTFHNKTCKAGVCFNDVVPDPENMLGWILRLPCHKTLDYTDASKEQIACFEGRGTCDKYEEPTDAEIAEDEAAIAAMILNFEKSLPLMAKVKAEHKGTNWRGIETCPVCQGNLHMTHAAINGHVWGKCETPNCLNWAE